MSDGGRMARIESDVVGVGGVVVVGGRVVLDVVDVVLVEVLVVVLVDVLVVVVVGAEVVGGSEVVVVGETVVVVAVMVDVVMVVAVDAVVLTAIGPTDSVVLAQAAVTDVASTTSGATIRGMGAVSQGESPRVCQPGGAVAVAGAACVD